jgi:dolichyl-phosphate beta-glucosyltransferase
VELSLVVPAYNEAARIAGTLQSMMGHLRSRHPDHEIIVVADGTDGTRERAAEVGAGDPRVTVIGSPERRGKGCGVREGVLRARGRVVGFVDADDKTPIEEMEKLLPLVQEGCDLVIGSRGMPESRIEVSQPLHRRLGSRGFAGLLWTLGLRHVRDTQCGFKFFRGEAAHRLFRCQKLDGYMFDVEVLFLAKRFGYRVGEVGVRWRDDGDSRLELVSGNWRNLVDVLRVRFGRYADPAPSSFAAERPV